MSNILCLFYRKNGQLRLWLYIPVVNLIISFLIWFFLGSTIFFVNFIKDFVFNFGG